MGDPKSDVGHVTFTVTEVNDAPVAADDTLSAVAEDSSTRTITFAELTGNDSKGAANESGQTLTVLSVNNGTAVGGTVAIVAGHIEFTPTANFIGTASFDYTVQDNGTTNGVGDPRTDIGLASFQVTAVNDAPALANVDAAAAYTENAAPVALDTVPLIVPSDIDTATLSSATIAITGGFQPGDVLNWPNFPIPASLSASYNAATGVLTINAVDTLADYQEVLRGITFSSTSDNPTNFGANPTRTITWTITDNGSPNLSSVSQTTTIAVTAVNDAPVLDNVASTVNLPPGGGTVTLSPGLTVSDVDNQNLASATVRVTGGVFPGDGNLLAANTAGTSITAVYNAGTETLTLSGADTLAHYQQVLATVTFQTTSPNPTNGGLNDTRTIEWQLNDGSGVANLSTVDTTTVDLSNVPPNDFNADANSDVLWRHNNGFVSEWQMNDDQIIDNLGVAQPSNAYHFQDTGDFNADGQRRHLVAPRQRSGRALDHERQSDRREPGGRRRSATIGTTRAPLISAATARATCSGATTTARSRSGPWMARRSRTISWSRRSRTAGTSRGFSMPTATARATCCCATTAARSSSGPWTGRRSSATSRSPTSGSTGTSSAPAISAATARTTCCCATTAARSSSGR